MITMLRSVFVFVLLFFSHRNSVFQNNVSSVCIHVPFSVDTIMPKIRGQSELTHTHTLQFRFQWAQTIFQNTLSINDRNAHTCSFDHLSTIASSWLQIWLNVPLSLSRLTQMIKSCEHFSLYQKPVKFDCKKFNSCQNVLRMYREWNLAAATIYRYGQIIC